MVINDLAELGAAPTRGLIGGGVTFVSAGTLEQPVIIVVFRGLEGEVRAIGPGGFARAWIEPFVTFDMTVAVGEVGAAIVEGSGEVVPCVTGGTIQKVAVVDAVRMFLNEDENFGGGGEFAELSILVVGRVIRISAGREEHSGMANHRIHGDGAGTFRPAGIALDGGEHEIDGTTKDAGIVADVWAERTVGVEEEVGVAFVELPIEDAVGPIVGDALGEILFNFGSAEVVGEVVAIIVGVHGGGEIELPVIVETEGLLGLGFAASQRGKKQGGEDCEDCDDDEKFNQSKGLQRPCNGTV